MATEKRLIDANELSEHKFPTIDSLYDSGWNDAIDAITENAPTVDAVEVVRCKDCKNFCPYEGEEHKGDCAELVGLESCVYEDDFCSYGERKDNG